MQQNKKKLYVEPRVKSVKFQVESGFLCSVDDCTGQEMKSYLENYQIDTVSQNTFGNMFAND